MRTLSIIGALALGLAVGAGAVAIAQTRPAPKPAAPAPRPAAQQPVPAYVVIYAITPLNASPFQKVTVPCPAGHKVFGGGFTAFIQTPPKTAGGKPVFVEAGIDGVRSQPTLDGSAWEVSGVSADAARLKAPWRLQGRAVCVRV